MEGTNIMAREDAEKVHKLLQQANEASKPLKDATLTTKIKEASDHIVKKLDKENN